MEQSIVDEKAALAAATQGDQAAFASLVRLYQRRAYAAAYSYVHNRDDALELAQDAFVRAFRAIRRFKPDRPFYPWLYRIIRNTCLNHLKKKRRRGEQSLEQLTESGFDVHDLGLTPDEAANREDVRAALLAALAELSPQQREILRLRELLEFSYAEIADTLGIPQGTVMSRLHGARKALRAVLEERRKVLGE
jgi:RNA polymerase sigma-70 factor, ECF subfamily